MMHPTEQKPAFGGHFCRKNGAWHLIQVEDVVKVGDLILYVHWDEEKGLTVEQLLVAAAQYDPATGPSWGGRSPQSLLPLA